MSCSGFYFMIHRLLKQCSKEEKQIYFFTHECTILGMDRGLDGG